MAENLLWAEKYRPKDLDSYVGNEEFVGKLRVWLENGELPTSLLLHSNSPGTGKTTVAKLIGDLLDAEVLYINASSENGIDVLREKITSFASSVSFQKWKIVILDEADGLTPNFQAAARPIMEQFSKHTRFIFTCNYVEKIIEPIVSRCSVFHIQPPNKSAVAKRMFQILDAEKITYDKKDVASVISRYYPDQRKITNVLQVSSTGGTLNIETHEVVASTYVQHLIEELKGSKNIKETFTEIRQLVVDSKVRTFEDLFRVLYDRVEEYAPKNQAMAILTIAEYQYKSTFVVDKEINAMALIIALLQIIKA